MKAFAIAVCACWALTAGAAPRTPTNDGEVLERVPPRSASNAKPAARTDLAAVLEQSAGFLETARAEGDPRYLGRAQALLAPWWSQPEPPLPVRMQRATILQARHDFAGALKDLDAVIAADPAHPQARLVRATIHQVQGRPAEAQGDCLRLPPTHALALLACATSAASVAGQAAASHAALETGVKADTAAQPAVRQWSLTLLADMARRLGRPAQAEAHFRQAQALGRDVGLLAAYSDFLLDQGRPREALALVAGEERHDGLLLNRTLAKKALGDASAAADVAELRSRFESVRRRGDAPHWREEARLLVADDPRAALALAVRNWETQREPEDLRLLLQAALAAGDRAAAQPALAWWRATKLEDAAVTLLAKKLA